MVVCYGSALGNFSGCAWNCTFGKMESAFLTCGKMGSPVCLPEPCRMSWQGQALMAGILIGVFVVALAVRLWRERI